ncbi:MAG: zeta toxin family protein [Steroidobacteraceae bacterium]
MKIEADQRPVLVALTGPNGAGKTTFYESHLQSYGLRFVNADLLSQELGIDPIASARLARTLCEQLVQQRESFIYETVFSDSVGDKLGFLTKSAAAGYAVVLCFVGISSHNISEQRVAMRVSQGGHDIPSEKLLARFPRTLQNLRKAINLIHDVWIFDNDDLSRPFRQVAVFENQRIVHLATSVPAWLYPIVLEHSQKP